MPARRVLERMPSPSFRAVALCTRCLYCSALDGSLASEDHRAERAHALPAHARVVITWCAQRGVLRLRRAVPGSLVDAEALEARRAGGGSWPRMRVQPPCRPYQALAVHPRLSLWCLSCLLRDSAFTVHWTRRVSAFPIEARWFRGRPQEPLWLGSLARPVGRGFRECSVGASRRRASEGFLVLLFAEVCSPRLRYHVAGAVPQSSSGLEGFGSDITLTRSGEWAV
ncbi:Hypothetical protein GLP15_2612 [Giardia lamblia P15]|uniref:Uncharacterized protein n=1 Tax=Giardia intestinalis (strain P15) TaxID=658858 RepID=E1F8U3_GIAIA|nr:Hypothetical protein GLP15_2612 [Giardia lamblia P15]